MKTTTLTLSAAALALMLGGALAQNAPVQLQPPRPAAAAAARPATPPPVSAREAIARANAYFNNASTMIADFSQIAADGRKSGGTLQVQKPGRMRFEYDRPSNLEIIADGKSVAIRDRRLNTQDLYLIGQTPLKFLLSEKIDIARDTKVLDVDTSNPDSVSILIEDKATLGGTSRIRLVFDLATFQLQQWTVTDSQGYDTIVSLANVDLASRPDPAAFRINQERMIETTPGGR